MEEITLSVMRNTLETEPVLRRVLDVFEREHNIHVNLQMLAWETAHQEIKQFAIRQRGPDVSTMGTTWVAELVSMNALRPFTRPDMAGFSQPEAFISGAWDSAVGGTDKALLAVPWLADTYILHYRRDLFAKAGIDPTTAFESLSAIDDTVRRLSEAGVEVPIQLPFHYDRFCLMHSLASWVWNKGGEFCTPDGSKVLFDQPEALAGIRDYFRLARHLSAEARAALSAPDSGDLFRQGRAALAFGTLSFMHSREQIDLQVLENWRAAVIPGPHFVGGVNLIVWKYSMRDHAALELIRYLNSPAVAAECAQAMLTSPARLAALTSPEYMDDPILQVIGESARTGRSYYPVRLWGLIEDRFVEALLAIANAVPQTSDTDLDALIARTIKPTAHRLNLTLSS